MASRRQVKRGRENPNARDKVDAIQLLEGRLSYQWKQKGLLLQALRHPSSTADGRRANRLVSNQRLEFLGDSVLDVVVGAHLMGLHPNEGEGFLSTARANMVSSRALAMRARNLGLDRLVEVELHSEYLRTVESTMADCLEAIIGSAFLDAKYSLEIAGTVIRNAGVLG